MTAFSQRGRSGVPWLVIVLLALTAATSVALVGVLISLESHPDRPCPTHVQEGRP
jgi:hypothetical protein